MSLLYPADNLLVMDYNRVLKTLNGMSEDEFMSGITENFELRLLEEGETSQVPCQHSFSLYIGGKWYRMVLKPEKLEGADDPVSILDSEILTRKLLDPILGIKDLKKDERIDFVGGIRGHEELERRCTVDCVCAIALYPCSVDELLNVADASLIMPPKSTWFEPKPRSGFVVNVFEDN